METTTKVVGFRLTDTVDRAIAMVAATKGASKSAFIIEVVLEYLETHREELIGEGLDISKLSDEIRASFNEALSITV